jgi:ceramide glucosyltransferase
MVVSLLEALFLVLSGLSAAGLLLTHMFTWVYFRWGSGCAAAGVAPPASVIRPVFEAGQSARGELRSFCAQNYPGDYEVLFCAERSDTVSIPVVRSVIAECPHRDARLLLTDGEDSDTIGKLRNTIPGLAAARHDIVVFADDDVDGPPSYLRETLPCLMDRRVGLAFSAPAYQGCETWAAALMSVFTNSLVLRVATACALRIFDGAIGTTMITRKSSIEAIGGLDQFRRQIVDDLPLGRAMARHGYRIHLLKSPAPVLHRYDTFVGCWSHIHRWLVIIRHYYPVRARVMSVFDLGLWWGLFYWGLAWLAGEGPRLGAYLVGGLILASGVSAAVVNVNFARDGNLWRFLWVTAVLEVLRLPLILHSELTDNILWRGRRFHIHRDGTATPIGDDGGIERA